MQKRTSLLQEYHSLSRTRRTIFLLESMDALSMEELAACRPSLLGSSFEELFESQQSKRVLLFIIPQQGVIHQVLGHVVDIKNGEVIYECYHPALESFTDMGEPLYLEEYGKFWYVIDNIEAKVKFYEEYYWLLDKDTLSDHANVDFKATGTTFLLAVNVFREGWKEWEVMWVYDPTTSTVQVITIPDGRRVTLDLQYYGSEWFLIPF